MGTLMSPGSSDGCPARNTLVAFDLGKLPAAELAVAAQHLAACRRCEEVLLDIQKGEDGDSLVARLRYCLAGPPHASGPTDSVLDALAATALATAAEWTAPYEDDGFDLDPDFDLDPGESSDQTFFGPYERLGKLGEGGMGVVYLARKPPFKWRVALKMIVAHRLTNPEHVARFFREVEVVTRLRHPNVVQVYDCGICEGVPYYTMELMEGGTLDSEIKAGPLTPVEAAQVVRTLASAMEYVHQKHVVHRDLKSANVLRARDGTLKISDFGLARWLDAGPLETTSAFQTGPDVILGTPGFMAPEQAACETADRPADIYALGAILYHALTGRPPFTGPKAEVLRLVGTSTPKRPSALRPGIPFALELICLKCLEKIPAARYLSAQALADDLDRWLKGESPRETPRWITRLGRNVRRHQTAAMASLVLATAGIPLIPLGTNAYFKSPARVIERIETDLARGRAVTLIGNTGKALWWEWKSGGKEGQARILANESFTLQSWPLGLVELLPDTRSENYTITAQVRHEESDLEGEVGLYFSRKAYPWAESELHFMAQVTFNAVRGDADRLARIPLEVMPGQVPRDNVVTLRPHLVSDESRWPFMNWIFSGTTGPHFKPLGTRSGVWHDLKVTVTPEIVTAQWNDEPPFSMTRSRIEESVTRALSTPLEPKPARPDFVPTFSARGGVGLYLRKGSASFRSVTITLLD
jgi:eukaryotic-like serine/threonine-protein kinase